MAAEPAYRLMREGNRFPETTEADLEAAVALRHALHRRPEVSGEEAATAARMATEMRALGADEVLTGLGGHGVAAVFRGAADGPTVALRAELDALPIHETGTAPHASEVAGVAHLCGHDGHMSMLYAVALALARRRPEAGRVILLYQPAEETGAGAAEMLADARVRALAPDWVFSLHNLPGMAHGHVALAEGPMACASAGIRIRLTGREAHASQPQHGRSPRRVLAALLEGLPALGTDAPLEDDRFAMVTVTHCRMGAPAFGIAPGEAELWATARTLRNDVMEGIHARATAMARAEAEAAGLDVAFERDEVFRASSNHAGAVAHLRRALHACGVPHGPEGQPWAPSEDFGRFAELAPSAMFFLGAGEGRPALHNPDYDFPDSLIPIGAGVFLQAVRDLTSG